MAVVSGYIPNKSPVSIVGFTSSSTTITINLPNSWRGIIFTLGADTYLMTMCMVTVGTQGGVTVKDIATSSYITHTTATNQLKFTITSTKNTYYYALNTQDLTVATGQ